MPAPFWSSSTTRWPRPRSRMPRRASTSPRPTTTAPSSSRAPATSPRRRIDEATAAFEIARAALELQKVRLVQAHHPGAVRRPRRHPQGLAGRLRAGRHADRQSREDRRPQGRFQAARAVPAVGRRRPDRRGRRSTRCRAGRSPARSTPSIRWSTSTAARCSCAPASPIPTSRCGPACSPASSSRAAGARRRAGAGKRHRAARRRDVRLPHRRTARRSRPRSSSASGAAREVEILEGIDGQHARSSPPASRSCATASPSRSSTPARAAPRKEGRLMGLFEFCIRRPVFATVLSLILDAARHRLLRPADGARISQHRRAGRLGLDQLSRRLGDHHREPDHAGAGRLDRRHRGHRRAGIDQPRRDQPHHRPLPPRHRSRTSPPATCATASAACAAACPTRSTSRSSPRSRPTRRRS